MPNVKRIIDANANRTREALRVMEEAARFILDDSDLCKELKSMRHDFAAAISQIEGLEINRNTTGDVGTTITTPREYKRESIAAVAIAAGKRLSEALRAIEEYSKVLPANNAKNTTHSDNISSKNSGSQIAGLIEQLRYRGYTIEKKLNLALSSTKKTQWTCCFLLTCSMCEKKPWKEVLNEAIEGGVDCVQIREKENEGGLTGKKLLAHVREIVSICHAKGVSVIVNDRPDIAMTGGADGVHLGQGDLPCDEVRKLFGSQLLIGVSTSCIEEAERAFKMGADYCGVGPMFETTTKKKDVIVGAKYLREYVLWGKLPHLAIGGIEPNEEKIGELKEAGLKGVAVSSVICTAENPRAIASQLTRLIND